MKNDLTITEACFIASKVCALVAIWQVLVSINTTLKEQNEIQKEFTTEIINQIKK